MSCVDEKIIEETEDDEIKTALNVLNEYIINHIKKLPAQEQKKAIDELIDKILNSDNIEHNEEVAIGVINNMLKEKEVPNKYVIDSAKELDDSTLTKLNEENEIPINDRRELIKAIDDDEKRKELMMWIFEEIERRCESILTGNYRNSYYKPAVLIIVLSHILYEQGDTASDDYLIHQYKEQYSRRRAFISELNSYKI